MFRLFVCMAFALALISCGSQQLPTSPSDAARPSSAQAASPSRVPASRTYSLWQIDGDSNPKNYAPATDGQCTDIQFPTDSSVYFPLKRQGTKCFRDQLNPLSRSGSLYYLTLGKTYTWKFQTKVNTNAGGIIWQEHPEDTCNDITPPVGLNVDTTSSPPRWYVFVDYPPNFGHEYDLIPYTNNVNDTWEIQSDMAGSGGFIKVWRNGKLVVNYSGIKYPTACKAPFWNFGPYPSQWKRPSSPGTYIDMHFNYMQLYTP